MKIKYSSQFNKQFKRYISKDKKLLAEFKNALFLINEYDSFEELRDHELRGKLKGLRSFSLSYSYRVIYQIRNSEVVFLRIGPHEEVYK